MDMSDGVYMQPRPQLSTSQTTGGGPHQQLVAQQYVITINGNINEAPHVINHTGIHVTAAIQLSCTGLSVLFGIVAILVGCLDADFAMPIWMGLCFFMVAGISGKIAAHKRTRCWVVAYMVLSIIASVAAGILVLNMLAAALHENHVFAISYARNSPFSISSAGAASIDGAVCIIALIEMITAIVASAFCCRGTCCAPVNPVQVQYAPGLPAGSVVLPPQGNYGQPMMVTQGQSVILSPTPPESSIYNSLPLNEAPPIPEKYHSINTQQKPLPVEYSAPVENEYSAPVENEYSAPVENEYSVPNSIRRQSLVVMSQIIEENNEDEEEVGEEVRPLSDGHYDNEHGISVDNGSDEQPLVN